MTHRKLRSIEDIDYEMGGVDIALKVLTGQRRKLKDERDWVIKVIKHQNRVRKPKVSDPDVTYDETAPPRYGKICLCSFKNGKLVINPKCKLKHKVETQCSVDGCEAKARVRGMCTRHYKTQWAREHA